MLVKAELKKASNTEILTLKGVDISTPNMTLFFFFFLSLVSARSQMHMDIIIAECVAISTANKNLTH